ncbi:acetyltransferase (GNAT) family protein [Aquimarina sp. MAR_2010_214]|uniref:GNAT family N-acetyltransferase n=1 Tax=Aquimarina sp. MAR_2010_214 TaxID=1250026 RepID=UPI000C709D7F|nr:GNAT family N-acetyltransferase [Aquimarina sp. MAR_2010_214]PKV49518.1 acetyltransferase (GNAT) family protein [Aquimarina sp. MAR_2010_214]
MIKASKEDKEIITNLLWNTFIKLEFPNSINFVAKQDQKRPARLRYLMEYQFNVALKFGEIWLSDDKKGCILLLFPETKRVGLSSLLWEIKLAFYSIGIQNVIKVLKRESQLKKKHPKVPFIHFWLMAVTPESQGEGVGQKLLSEVLEKYKNSTKPIYLETTTQSNLKFYTKNGFNIFDNTHTLNYPLFFLKYEK